MTMVSIFIEVFAYNERGLPNRSDLENNPFKFMIINELQNNIEYYLVGRSHYMICTILIKLLDG